MSGDRPMSASLVSRRLIGHCCENIVTSIVLSRFYQHTAADARY